MEVSIYIDTYHSGPLKNGTGKYTIVLEYITSSGVPKTREYMGGVNCTSKNRTAIYACKNALRYLTVPCEVKLQINSEYIVQSIQYLEQWLSTGKNAKGMPAKNMDLWQQLTPLLKQHKVNFIYAGSSSYTAAMANLLKHTQIDYKIDKEDIVNV